MSVQEVYDRGFGLRCEGKYGEAKMAFQQVLAVEPDHMKSQWQLALIQGFEGDFDGSLEALKVLSSSHPRETEVLYDLAMTYMMLGFQDEACAEFRKILVINPEHEKALHQAKYC